MSFFDDIFGGGDKTTTSTTSTAFSPYVTGAQSNLAMGAFNGMVPYLANPSAYTAPLSAGQQRVGQAANSLLDFGIGSQNTGQVTDYAPQFLAGQGRLNPFVGSSGAGALEKYIPGYSQQAIDASTIDMDDIRSFANPFAQDVLDTQSRQRERGYQTAQSDIGLDAAAGGAFGGSGEYIRRAMLDRSLIEAEQDAAAGVMYDSYGQGAQLAGNNAAARSAALANAGNDIYSRAAGSAGFDQSAIDALFGRASTAGQFDQAALGSAANFGLSRGQQMNGNANDYVSRVGAASGLLGAFGDLQRSYDQSAGDKNWTQFSRLASFIPGAVGTTSSTAPNTSPGLGQTLLGGALAVGGMATGNGGSLLGNWLSPKVA